MPKIKVYCYADLPRQDDHVEIPDEEWNAMSEEEQEERLVEEAREFMGNCIDFGACVELEESE